jgi:hypothetical protein
MVNEKASQHMVTKVQNSNYLEDFMHTRTILGGKFFTALCMGIFFVGTAFITGCKKSDSVTDAGQTTTVSDDVADAADAVSDALASNNGGAMDQVNDVFEIAGGTGVGGAAGVNMLAKSYSDSVSLKFNTSDTSWSLYIYRDKGIAAWWSRNYKHQFIGPGGKAQAARVGAVLIKHQLLTGTGHFQTLRLIHDLMGISSNWTASINADTTITINGTYSRAGRDSVILGSRKGTLMTDSLSLTFTDVKGPRGTRLNRSEKTSGTISGVYIATISVPGKTTTTITKSFTITLGGGNATFTIDGNKFTADLATGNH